MDRLRKVSDIAVIAVAILMAVVVVKTYLMSPSTPVPPQLDRNEDKSFDIQAVGLEAAHKKYLLLVLKKGCRYCEESTPFYRELAQLEASGQTDIKMVAVFEDSVDVGRSVLQAEHIRMEVVGGVSLRKLRISATPTLILVDEGGRVVRVWEGMLSRKAEEDLKAIITLAGKG